MTAQLAPDRTRLAPRLALATAALVVGALALVARPLFGTAVVVGALGGIAAAVALVAIAAIVRLVVSDLRSGARRAPAHPSGRHRATYDAARTARWRTHVRS